MAELDQSGEPNDSSGWAAHEDVTALGAAQIA
jgi:hypothetical protein